MKTTLFAVLATSLFSLSALAAVAGNAKNAKCCPGNCSPQQTQSCSCCNHKK